MELPKGVRIFTRPDRKRKPWCVEWREPLSRKKRLKSFATEAEQVKFAMSFGGDIARLEEYRTRFDAGKWRRFLDFERRIGGIHRLDEVYDAWRDKGKRRGGGSFDKLGLLFLAAKEREGVSDEQLRRYRVLLRELEGAFPDRLAGGVDDLALTSWIDSRPVAAITKNNLRKQLRAFYAWCARKGHLDENPVERIDKWGSEEKPVGILTPEEGRRFFAANRDFPSAGRFALEAFAGLRYSSARRMRREHINFEDRGIELPGARLKTRKRIYVDGFPDNLWDWLDHAPAECWTMTERQYQQEKIDSFLRAGVPHPRNCFRHSFATYHVSKYKNAGETATLLCHTNIQTLNRYYRGNATHSAGNEWFGIRP